MWAHQEGLTSSSLLYFGKVSSSGRCRKMWIRENKVPLYRPQIVVFPYNHDPNKAPCFRKPPSSEGCSQMQIRAYSLPVPVSRCCLARALSPRRLQHLVLGNEGPYRNPLERLGMGGLRYQTPSFPAKNRWVVDQGASRGMPIAAASPVNDGKQVQARFRV